MIDHAKNSVMHQRERWKVILTEVRARGVIYVKELVDLTSTSSATLRRDLDKLEEMGQVRCVHGGIEAVEASQQTNLSARSFGVNQTLNAERERSIAEAAAALCQNGDSIIINAGSTTWFMATYLRQNRMQILTNSFPIADELIRNSNNRIVLPGGERYREQGIILSPFDEDAVQHFTASRMFMSCYSIGPLGVIEGDPLIACAEAKLLCRAEKLVVLVDSSKFEARGSIAVCKLSRVHTLITDVAAPPQFLAQARSEGVEVIIVGHEKCNKLSAA
jgi:DeoR family ulaG and ulaABCDEF operon transcriptional repressor